VGVGLKLFACSQENDPYQLASLASSPFQGEENPLYRRERRQVLVAANSDMRLVIAGAGGRMGRTLIAAIAATKGVTLAGAIEAAGSPMIGRDAGELAGLGRNGIEIASDAAPLLQAADGLMEFTVHTATAALAELTAAAGIAHVIGTTGHTAEEDAAIAKAAARAPIVKSGNMSLGVNLIAALVKRVAQTLDENYDIEILEMHHNKKIDAPSGTALMFGRAAAAGRSINLATHSVRGRDGLTGARRAVDIGFASLRGGTVVGDHTVIFAGPAERIELTHRAEDRMIFARGALHAALWARGRKPGLYSMADVLGLADI
jgi:4-hydroxy-tetrahydrodipicolinate reductase